MRRAPWLCLIPLTALLAALAAAPAGAAVTTKKAIWGPIERDGVSQFPVYADLGVGIYQTTLQWDQVAPSRPASPRDPADPAYRWPTEVDRAVQLGAPHGIAVSLVVIGAPGWANGGRSWRWAPQRPEDFADFVEAARRRYPAVRHWMIWNEPTKASNFQPLKSDRGRPLRGTAALRGPRLYARMLDAAYVRLKRISRRNLVIGGNTFTVGTVRPLHFVRALRLPNGRRPRMDLWGHNAFTAREPDLRRRPVGGGIADFSDLDTLAAHLDRYQRRGLRLFVSEFTLTSDHPNHEFNFYVTRATQARWITQALRITRSWRRIYTFGYLGLYDDPVRPGGDQVERGLIERSGKRKPAYEAFKRG